jgi:prepilin-type N-terminal cleavage/methylation domain-containing protein
MRTRPGFLSPIAIIDKGFTLLEVLVALVIFAIGILGLSANAALVSRLAGNGSRLTVAGTVATARLEQLRALPCASVVAGTGLTRGIEERWSVAPLGPAGTPRAFEVQLSVRYRLRAYWGADSARTQQFTGAVPCR